MDKISASVLLKGLAPEGFADEAAIDLVTTDSREVRPGCIFVAFPGEKLARRRGERQACPPRPAGPAER